MSDYVDTEMGVVTFREPMSKKEMKAFKAGYMLGNNQLFSKIELTRRTIFGKKKIVITKELVKVKKEVSNG